MDLLKTLKCSRGSDIDHIDAGATPCASDRKKTEALTDELAKQINHYQMQLHVNAMRGVLVILQGMDCSGKDGTVRRVFDRVNPSGCIVTSFKEPTPVEKQHDFLWRAHAAVPPRGIIGIFNRSYYEDTLVVRVHADQLLTPEVRATKNLWQWRFDLINNFEKMLVKDNVTILKFFLHISKDEQRSRLRDRQKDSAKQWKLAWSDFKERQYWDEYITAYNECLASTSSVWAPWYIIPSDHKWYRNFAVATIIEKTLSRLKLPIPRVTDKKLLKVKI
ncbi:MAG: PPK2 family polyphosphate kinase [Endomicrobiales bacterium]|jgi:PPK2 family polyphosphate:nucleotide phosphotransferase